ncbi:MAG: hypothetical protein RJQ01_06850 [Microcella sp.]|uniref:hypothetical protein n=1 Tax=Microcella sp. TaxID=1913979 RepID=UPI0033149B1F
MTSARTQTWSGYRESIGDRSPLFAAMVSEWGISTALYPGCYLDLSPSTAIDDVTYVDNDARAARYFATEGLAESELGAAPASTARRIAFIAADYTTSLPIAQGSVDLIISLYAGPVWDHCRPYLAPGGLLLANTSHGDASVAALDPDLELVAAVHHRDGRYRIERAELDAYLHPKSAVPVDAESIRRSGRGVAYTKTAFAYVFQLRQR